MGSLITPAPKTGKSQFRQQSDGDGDVTMRITPIEFELLLDIPQPHASSMGNAYVHTPAPSRAPGIHVTSILRAVALKLGKLSSEWADEDAEPDAACRLRWAIGLAWEKWLAKRIPLMAPTTEFAFHRTVCKWQDIYGSPDAVWLDWRGNDAVVGIDEIKVTWASAKHDPTANWLRMAQIKAYCFMHGQELGYPVTNARVWILYLNGDYTRTGKGPQPLLKAWAVEFDQAELQRNWDLVWVHRDLGVWEVGEQVHEVLS